MSSGESALMHLPGGPVSVVTRVSSLVVLNICDCYIRRPEHQVRVIGALLGHVAPDGTVEVKNSYPIPHNESSELIELDKEMNKSQLKMHLRVNSKEVLVGWYSTGASLHPSDAIFHHFYSQDAPNAVHLIVDTTFTSLSASSVAGGGTKSDRQIIRAYVGQPLSLGDRQLAMQFLEVQAKVNLDDAALLGFDKLTKIIPDRLPSDLDSLQLSVNKLQCLLDLVCAYVDGVVDGKIQADNNIGRYVADTLALVPQMDPESFDQLFNNSIQDMLLVLYLSNLTRTQLSIAEKLNTLAQPM